MSTHFFEPSFFLIYIYTHTHTHTHTQRKKICHWTCMTILNAWNDLNVWCRERGKKKEVVLREQTLSEAKSHQWTRSQFSTNRSWNYSTFSPVDSVIQASLSYNCSCGLDLLPFGNIRKRKSHHRHTQGQSQGIPAGCPRKAHFLLAGDTVCFTNTVTSVLLALLTSGLINVWALLLWFK